MSKKVTELPAATTPLGASDVLLVVQGGTSKQAPVSGLPSSGGGLTNLTETKNTSTPNATVPAVSLSVTITETNGDFVIAPKGTGALLADVPDNATSGGNKRGARAVDWQLIRSAATQVASGDGSTIGGGEGNTASGTGTTVSGGNGNSAGALYGVVGGGVSNNASTNFSTVGGGQSNTTGGVHATVCGGNNNTAGGVASTIMGGKDATTRTIAGAEAYSAGMFSIQGDAQRGHYILRRNTTNATPARLSSDGLNATNQFQVTLPNSSAYIFRGKIIARQNSTGDCSGWEVYGVIKRGAAAANTALVGTPTVTLLAQDAGAAAWVVAITADTTTGCLAITVTGEAAKTINWVGDIETVEVVG